jgi:hypothetical protein
LVAVIALSDSVSGVPLARDSYSSSNRELYTCKSCRVTIPLAEVDSMRFGSRNVTGAVLATVVVIGIAAFTLDPNIR